MQFRGHHIISIKKDAHDTSIINLKPNDGSEVVAYKPGNYVYLRNPKWHDPLEEHPYSIASSPTERSMLEFCVRAVGDWSGAATELSAGDIVEVSDPVGKFTWDDSLQEAVFLLGGIGISPIMSMLRYFKDSKSHPSLTMLYGNRNPESVPYRRELEEFTSTLHLKLSYIYSHLPENHEWTGYRGFITEEMIKKEVDISKEPTFFVIGPPVFIEHISQIMNRIHIPGSRFRTERIVKK